MNAPQQVAAYNFAYLDEQTKRMIRRAILKAVAIPGYQVPFASREMPMPYGWGTGAVQVTAAILGADDVLKVIDQGADVVTMHVDSPATIIKVAEGRSLLEGAGGCAGRRRHPLLYFRFLRIARPQHDRVAVLEESRAQSLPYRPGTQDTDFHEFRDALRDGWDAAV